MYKSEEAKKAYFAERYRKNKEKYKANQKLYWENKTKEWLGKDDVTEEEIKQCYNNYHKEYRHANPKTIKQNMNNFWERQANKGE